ncbi:MAG: polyprenyl synthetase family protein [Ruminococcus sp.]|nr:polyprenyl synthetase family protein [Ruminococcus sp.]
MMNVKEQLGQYAARVETYILEQVAAMQKAAAGMDTDMLYDAMRHSLSAGGKRIRPALIYAFCEVCGGSLQAADSAACAMEMTHTSSLIFDDLPAMDDDDLRRGKPSCHKAFGEATAILAGDALICAPFMILAQDAGLTAEQKVALISVLAEREGAAGMVGGQLMDMQFETMEKVTAEELETMCLGKTGALMEASCKMGCLCAGGTPEQIQAAGEYGKSVGLAFQIIDDILDVTSTAEMLGKPIGSDAEEEKKTFVTILGIEEARKRAQALSEHAHAQLDMFENTEFLHALTDELLVRVK